MYHRCRNEKPKGTYQLLIEYMNEKTVSIVGEKDLLGLNLIVGAPFDTQRCDQENGIRFIITVGSRALVRSHSRVRNWKQSGSQKMMEGSQLNEARTKEISRFFRLTMWAKRNKIMIIIINKNVNWEWMWRSLAQLVINKKWAKRKKNGKWRPRCSEK